MNKTRKLQLKLLIDADKSMDEARVEHDLAEKKFNDSVNVYEKLWDESDFVVRGYFSQYLVDQQKEKEKK